VLTPTPPARRPRGRPWSGLAGFLGEIFRMQAESQELTDFVTTIPRGGRDELERLAIGLTYTPGCCSGDQQAGALRADVTRKTSCCC
jgi:hypothetical protein